MIDFNKLNIGTSIQYQGQECSVSSLCTFMDPNVNYPAQTVIKRIHLVDLKTYQ